MIEIVVFGLILLLIILSVWLYFTKLECKLKGEMCVRQTQTIIANSHELDKMREAIGLFNKDDIIYDEVFVREKTVKLIAHYLEDNLNVSSVSISAIKKLSENNVNDIECNFKSHYFSCLT